MYVVAHKLEELRQKLASLEQEFDDWRRLSEPPASKKRKSGGPLRQHHTQIRRITGQLDAARKEVADSLDQLAGNAEILARGRELQREILGIHRVWDFFRGKFALRCVEWFAVPLRAADELAWACYRPAAERVSPRHIPPKELKEPPLVFFNGGLSPFSRSRSDPFFAERVEREEIEKPKLRQILQSLPVPVVGIPWFQVKHLPDAPAIAHEVGHIVLNDLRLSAGVGALLDQALERVHEGRHPAWRAWLREIFADLYGVLALGPAFVESLFDALAASPAAVASERRAARAWRGYPTAYLRVLFNLEALAAADFADVAGKLKKRWQNAYPSHSMAEFVPDLGHVAGALLHGPLEEFGGAALSEVISFPREQFNLAVGDKAHLLAGELPEQEDIRTLYAAARLAFSSDPAAYAAHGAHSLAMIKIGEVLEARGVRGDEPGDRALEEYDARRGRRIVDILRGKGADAAPRPAAT